MMKSNQVNFRVDPGTVQELTKIYGTTSEGFRRSSGALLALRKIYLPMIKGKFTREQIIAIADSLNTSMLDESEMSSKAKMMAGFEDSENLESGFSRHGANFQEFQQTFSSLTPAECFFLIDEINRFWNIPEAYGSPTPDLEKLIKNLS